MAFAACGAATLANQGGEARAQGAPAGSVYQRGTEANEAGQGERIVAAAIAGLAKAESVRGKGRLHCGDAHDRSLVTVGLLRVRG